MTGTRTGHSSRKKVRHVALKQMGGTYTWSVSCVVVVALVGCACVRAGCTRRIEKHRKEQIGKESLGTWSSWHSASQVLLSAPISRQRTLIANACAMSLHEQKDKTRHATSNDATDPSVGLLCVVPATTNLRPQPIVPTAMYSRILQRIVQFVY